MSKILVTGGAGFIGSHIVEQLHKQGYEVVVLDDLSTGSLLNLPSSSRRLKVIIGSILDEQKLSEALSGCCGVIHLAAIASVQASIDNPVEAHKINFDGLLMLLNMVKKNSVERFIFASSAAVYGDKLDEPAIEGQTLSPMTPYAIDKLSGEYYLDYYRATYQLKTTSYRFFNVYGPRQNPLSHYSGVISIFLSNFINGNSITFFGDGKQTRDFIFVKDLARILVDSIGNRNTFGRIINIGSGKSVSLIDIASYLSDIFKKSVNFEYKHNRIGDIRNSSANIDLLKEVAGDYSFTPIQVGLQETVNEINAV
ncbi:NAD-dependent epimerase/dehydratase family protein [Polynucleobacter sp. AP-RePozz3-80-G7]|uniref:NAD-dependent epimerase/dehydratase family protein n=1 Tax=Polynucleobacter sp. AP-RePozz3-80-G7 TaxID=2689105 RepID=UPI001C0CE673|nr:NAD-dependent epimerase/dehydratase family protein [Polynucleobacter sp. AP-RePozz3-80-G7]MBU3638550.1 NAD-dependent epimerase/dehydratase family protein [Polynucleobacter sp. AP-RePozz3-80-G7]